MAFFNGLKGCTGRRHAKMSSHNAKFFYCENMFILRVFFFWHVDTPYPDVHPELH